MKLELYVAGASRDEGKISCIGGAGCVLAFTDKEGRVQKREFYFGLGGSGQNMAEVQSARLALASVIPLFRLHPAVVFTYSPFLAGILTGSEVPAEMIGQSDELLRWYGYYRDISVEVVAGDHKTLDRAMELAKLGMETQKNYDSLTQRELAHVR